MDGVRMNAGGFLVKAVTRRRPLLSPPFSTDHRRNLNVNFYCRGHFTRDPLPVFPSPSLELLSVDPISFLTKKPFQVRRDSLHFHFYTLHLLFLTLMVRLLSEINFSEALEGLNRLLLITCRSLFESFIEKSFRIILKFKPERAKI